MVSTRSLPAIGRRTPTRLALTMNSSTAAWACSGLSCVAEHVGHVPSTAEYKRAREELRAAGEDVELFSRLYAHFMSWPRATEALSLSESNSARSIEARFRHRQVGKPWRYTEARLREALLAMRRVLRASAAGCRV
jgi:hypothetical protein